MNFIPTLLIVAGLGLTACHAGPVETPDTPLAGTSDVKGARDGATTLAVGETLLIELPSNATTGYAWAISDAKTEVLSPGSPFGQEITDPHEPGMVGVGGTTAWRFRAVRRGTATLTFTYGRPWETTAPAAETATYTITVR